MGERKNDEPTKTETRRKRPTKRHRKGSLAPPKRRRVGIWFVGVAGVLFFCLGKTAFSPIDGVLPHDGSYLGYLCRGGAWPFYHMFGWAAYVLPVSLGIVGIVDIWRVHYIPKARWTVRGVVLTPLAAGVATFFGNLLFDSPQAGGKFGEFYFSYFEQALGGFFGYLAGILVVSFFVCKLWGWKPWNAVVGTRRKPGPLRRLMRWFWPLLRDSLCGLAQRLFRRQPAGAPPTPAPQPMPVGQKPPPRSTPPAPKPVPSPDEPFVPNIGGDWAGGSAPIEKPPPPLVANPVSDQDEAFFTPLPDPEVDEPLPLEILPDPPPQNCQLDSLQEEASQLLSRIVGVIYRTTKVRLAPTGTEPQVGLRTIRYEFQKERGQGLSVERVKKAASDLQLELKSKEVRIHLADAIRVEVPLPKELRRFAPVRPMLEELPEVGNDDPLVYALGRQHDGAVFTLNVDHAQHILVGGGAGGGKSVLLHAFIFSLIFRYPPSRVRLALFDPKMLEFSPYRGLPHLFQPVVVTADGFYQLVDNLSHELERRKRVLVEDPAAELPRLITIVDEFRDHSIDKLIRIIAEGRALKMYFILATQHPTAEVISSSIKANLLTSVAVKTNNTSSSNLIVSCADAAELLSRGDAIVNGPDGLTRIQGAWVRTGKGADMKALKGYLANPEEFLAVLRAPDEPVSEEPEGELPAETTEETTDEPEAGEEQPDTEGEREDEPKADA